jgi:hypothetical protein
MTSGPSRTGGRMESGTPPVGSTIAEGILDVAAAVGSTVTVGGATAAGRPAGAWGVGGTASAVPAETWGPDGADSGLPVGALGTDGTASVVPAETWGPGGAATRLLAGARGPDDAASTVPAGTWGPDGAASTAAVEGRLPASRPANTYCWKPDSPVGAALEIEGDRRTG